MKVIQKYEVAHLGELADEFESRAAHQTQLAQNRRALVSEKIGFEAAAMTWQQAANMVRNTVVQPARAELLKADPRVESALAEVKP
jgi:hypothetical protein